jgi:hypothetical protein
MSTLKKKKTVNVKLLRRSDALEPKVGPKLAVRTDRQAGTGPTNHPGLRFRLSIEIPQSGEIFYTSIRGAKLVKVVGISNIRCCKVCVSDEVTRNTREMPHKGGKEH